MLLLWFKNTLKYGKVDGIQRHKCAACGKQFRREYWINSQSIWNDYIQGKQTYLQLAAI